jgi:hypothetical protein
VLRLIHWTAAWVGSVSSTSKLTAPDFERFALTPCPMASLASSGIKALSSLLARSWSRKASPGAAEERGELRPGIRRAHIDDADGLDARPRRLGIDQVGRFAGLHAAPKFLFRRHQNAEIERVHGDCNLDPFTAAGDD